MEKFKRTVFFWSLVIFFFIIAPAVVLRAGGYRFDPDRGVFVHSGSITLKSNPQAIDINLNGKLITSKTLSRINSSYTLTSLIPKDYTITVSAPDFQTWRKKTDVHSGVSSEFWNILLVRNNYEKTTYDSAGIENFFVSPKNKFVVFSQNESEALAVKILNIKDNAIENSVSFPDWQILDKSKEENIEWSPEEDYLSIPVQKTTILKTPVKKGRLTTEVTEEKVDYAYFIFNPKTNTSFNLNEFLGRPAIQHVRWDPKDKNYLFFLSENTLYRANIALASDIIEITTEVTAFDLSESGVYFTKSPNHLIYKTALDGKSEPTQLTSSFPKNTTASIAKLIAYDDDRIALLNQDKEFFIYNQGEHANYFRKLGDNIEGLQFSNDGKKLLYWTRNELLTYFLLDWTVQPLRAENEVQSITRYSEELKNIQWFKDYEHIIFSAGDQLKIVELDPRDGRNTMNLPKINLENPFAVYNNSLENLFFIDKSGDTAILNSIIFPEDLTNVLGF